VIVDRGTRYLETGGRLTGVVDRTGATWATIGWDGERLARLDVPGARVVGTVIDDPLLGPAHAIVSPEGEPLTTVSAIEWVRPTEIPAIAAPGRLPRDAGGAILNALALLARRAGVPALRYAGPYPTSALYHALARSFRTTATETELAADLIDRMTRLARDPIAIDFVPAPHERIAIAGGHVELRDGLERAVIDSVPYTRDGSPARLIDDRAELWFGDVRYAMIARLSATGELIDGPHRVPPCTGEPIGARFPDPLVSALGSLVADAAPPLLARDVAAWLRDRTIVWADTGGRAARLVDDRLEIHGALWRSVAPHGLARLALALAEAITPVAIAAVVGELARVRVEP